MGPVGDARQSAYRGVDPPPAVIAMPVGYLGIAVFAVVAASDCRHSRRRSYVDPTPRRRAPRAMTAAASRSGTSTADLAEASLKERPKPRPASPPPLAAAARSSLSSSQLPVWAARVVFLLGLLNIASALVRRSPRLLDWSQDYCRPSGPSPRLQLSGLESGVGCW